MNKKMIGILLSIILIMTLSNIATAEVNLNIKNDNSPPNPPSIIVPNTITVRKWFLVEATVVDPNGDDIYIRFNASILPVLPNFWLGPLPSGFIYKSLVKYNGPIGTYTLGVQAKDIYDAESEWTNIQFNVTKVRTCDYSFLRLLDNCINIFPMLQKILQRL